MFAKAVASKWRHFRIRVNECFAPEFVVFASFLLLGSCYTMADHAFVFRAQSKWKYWPLKGRKKETDFVAIVVWI